MTDPPHKVRVVCARCDYDTRRTQRAGAERTLDELRRVCRCGRCGARASHGLLTIEAVAETQLSELQPPRPEWRWPRALIRELEKRARERAAAVAAGRRRSAESGPLILSRTPAIHLETDNQAPEWLEFLLRKDPRLTFIQNVCFAAIGFVVFLIATALLLLAITAPVTAPFVVAVVAFTIAVVIQVISPAWQSRNFDDAEDPRILTIALPVFVVALFVCVNLVAPAYRHERIDAHFPYLRHPPGEVRDEARHHFCETRLYWIERGGAGYYEGDALDQLIGHCPDYIGVIARVRAGEPMRLNISSSPELPSRPR